MVPTEAGQILLRHVRRSVLETNAVIESIAALQGGEQNPIRISCTQGLANELVPATLAASGRQLPSARFRIWADSAKTATQRVERAAEGRVGTECGRTWRSRWAPNHQQQNECKKTKLSKAHNYQKKRLR